MTQSYLRHTQLTDLLGRLEMFRDLSKDTLRKMASKGRQYSLRRGEQLFRQGDAARDLYAVISGQIKVCLRLSQGVEKLLYVVERGGYIGAAPVYLGVPHHMDAAASKDSHLIAINRDTLVQCAHCDTELANRLLTFVAHYKLQLIENFQSCSPHSAHQRVACFLLKQRPQPDARRYEFLLGVSKKEVAAALNIAQETLSRVLRQMCEAGLVAVQGRLIQVLDADQLEAIKETHHLVDAMNPDYRARPS